MAKKKAASVSAIDKLRGENTRLKKELEELMTAALHQTMRMSSIEETNGMLETTVEEQAEEISSLRSELQAAVGSAAGIVSDLRSAMATIGNLSRSVESLTCD